ncbi:unnamed protein product [Lepeophtheirus salmonis]|uniref:(salmon louse) hypothetical protein n=1 Tax=Lepeophtheirus salmonis TaxID=72036 RepID=A0A7R8CWY0_LEPSM|nr:unnamed protein product [Lepeophtheirus salmonis]CAF2926259.1 unnamed protein product [Lepeophtheirus salmonis]
MVLKILRHSTIGKNPKIEKFVPDSRLLQISLLRQMVTSSYNWCPICEYQKEQRRTSTYVVFKYQKSFGMEIEFTSISLGIATRAALRNFVDEWRSKKLGSDIRLCTSYGGQCEAPDHLELCSEANTPLSWAIFPSILVNIIVNYIL